MTVDTNTILRTYRSDTALLRKKFQVSLGLCIPVLICGLLTMRLKEKTIYANDGPSFINGTALMLILVLLGGLISYIWIALIVKRLTVLIHPNGVTIQSMSSAKTFENSSNTVIINVPNIRADLYLSTLLPVTMRSILWTLNPVAIRDIKNSLSNATYVNELNHETKHLVSWWFRNTITIVVLSMVSIAMLVLILQSL